MSVSEPKKYTPVRPPPDHDRAPTTVQLAQGLIKMLRGKQQISQALALLPNIANRTQVDKAIGEGISNLLDDIRSREGL